jgi:ABC-type multidrug transport system ATPase subunit
MIEVKNLTKLYGKMAAANNVSLVALPGEITILLGENGAGKSTTIKSITGLLKYKGEIKICGHDNRSNEAKRNFGYIPETPVLYDKLTVLEHIEFIGNAYKLGDYMKEAEKLLAIFHLEEKRKTLAKELSKGMRQKLSMLLALLIKPKALLVDEPMMGLDPQSIEETLALFVKLKNEGTSVFVSTHIIDVVDEIWDSAYIMKKGSVLCNVRKENLGEDSLKEIFFRYDAGQLGEMKNENID